jgi:2-polyprenyl-6-methoxyphenol hydroxylase-like FAD-dependent oxidoreductase
MSVNIIIIGCGRQGAELAKSLSVKGFDVTVVDNDQAAFERLGSSFGGRVILGDGIDRDTLIKGGIEKLTGWQQSRQAMRSTSLSPGLHARSSGSPGWLPACTTRSRPRSTRGLA